MRKCPNCKNPLPVGARRCVHCRALVGDTMNEHDNSSTHMGFGGSYTSEEERASSTSLGLPGSLTLSRNVDGGSRRQMNHGFDESPHHTMLGLGPVMSNSRNSYDSNNDTMGAFSGQRTISGMPGISGFSVNSMNRSSARTPERSLKAVSMRPTREVQTVSDADLMSMRQNTPAVSVAVPPSDALRSSPKLDAFTPSSTAKTPTSSDAVFDSMLQFSAASDANDDDPFAGLPGVAPKPSSLVDEEFVDLTSKLFGDDFAAGTSNVDDDEDGWDFDFAPSSPEPNVDVPKLNIPDPEPAKVEAPKVADPETDEAERPPVISVADPVAAIKKTAETPEEPEKVDKAEKTSHEVVVAELGASKRTDKVATPAATPEEIEEASSAMGDFVLKCAAWSTLCVYLLWGIVSFKDKDKLFAGDSAFAGILLATIVAFCFISNIGYLALFDKSKGKVRSAVLLVATVLLGIGAVYANGLVAFNMPLIVIPIVLQLIGVVMNARR